MGIKDLLIDGPDAHRAFEHSDLPPTVLENIHNVLETLHEAGLVVGDMRRPSILLVKSRGAYDEDAFGEHEWHGQPITWAFGAEPACLIEKRYDEEMSGMIVIDIDTNE